MFPSDKKHGAKRSIIPEKIILQQSNVSSGPALVDILDKLIRMDVVAKEAPINDENNKKKSCDPLRRSGRESRRRNGRIGLRVDADR